MWVPYWGAWSACASEACRSAGAGRSVYFVSLAATRELAAAFGVEPAALLRANPDRSWVWEDGALCFERLAPGDVVRLPDGRETQIVRMGTGLDDFQSLLAVPQFASAWNDIQTQIQSEGGSDVALRLVAAQSALRQSFAGLTGPGGPFSTDPTAALASAKQLVIAGTTIAGAVQGVESLLSAAQGADPTQAFQLFTGTLIGIATAAGAVSAGIGAAIVAGIGAALSLMQNAGFFGTTPQGTQICSGLYLNPAPTIQVGCVGMFGPPPSQDPFGGRIKPGSPYWRRFPKSGGPHQNDSKWFDGTSSFQWSGSTSGPLYVWTTYPDRRMIDMAFADWHYLACETVLGGLGDFQAAFKQAWIANQEFALNGLKPQPDAAVLDNLLRVWNRAHDSGTYLDVAPASKPFVQTPSPDGRGGWGGCPPNLPPLFQTVIAMLIANPQSSTPIVGNAIRINTGARKKHITIHLGPLAPAPGGTAPAAPGLSTGAKVALGVGGAAVVLGGAWLGLGRPLTVAALQHAVGRVVDKL